MQIETTMVYHPAPITLAIIKHPQTINAGEGVENRGAASVAKNPLASILARKIPQTEEPGGTAHGSQRIRHD